jgi:hypothetical protein
MVSSDSAKEILPAVIDDSPCHLAAHQWCENVRIGINMIRIQHPEQGIAVFEVVAPITKEYPE